MQQPPGWGPQDQGPQESKPAKGGVVAPAIGIVVAIVAFCLVAGRWAGERAQRPTVRYVVEPAPGRADQPLTGIALFKGRTGFDVCSRTDLHGCVLRFGYENSGERGTFEFVPTDIRAAASCDTQREEAIRGCTAAGLGPWPPMGDEQGDTWARCLLPHGVFYRGSHATMSRVDPRDPQVEPGAVRLQCREGYRSGSFGDLL